MALLATQTVTLSSLDPVYSVPDETEDTFYPGDRTFIHVKNNSSVASVTIVVDDPNSGEPEASIAFNPDVEVVVEPEGSRFAGPFTASRFQLADDGYVHMTSDTTTDVEVAILSINFAVG